MNAIPERNSVGVAAWICLAVAWACFLLPIPGLGLFVGWPLNLVAFILAIVAMSKRGAMAGLFQLLASLIASPVVYLIGWIVLAGTAASLDVAAESAHQRDAERSREIHSSKETSDSPMYVEPEPASEPSPSEPGPVATIGTSAPMAATVTPAVAPMAPSPDTEPAENSQSSAIVSAEPAGPSFDCSKAGTAVEALICADARLANLDLRLAGSYTALLASSRDPSASRREQRNWLKYKRNACDTVDCLLATYQLRVNAVDAARLGN